MKVYVAVYEHRHGTDIQVFDSNEKAEEWQVQIAKEYWDEAFEGEDEPMPDDEAEMCEMYWCVRGESMTPEYFNIEEKEVL